jgi:hypothetical protein
MKIRNFLSICLALLIVSTIAFTVDSHSKEKKSVVYEQVMQTSVQSKEAYKVDDAEYTAYVVSKSNLATAGFGGIETVALLGAIALVVHTFRKSKSTVQKIYSLIILLAVAVVSLFAPPAGLALYSKTAITGAFAIKFKTDDLTGDDKKTEREFLENLQKRIELSNLPETMAKSDVLELINKAVADSAKEMGDKIKGLDMNKIGEMLDDKTGFKSILIKQGLEINELKQKMINARGDDGTPSIREQVKMWVETNEPLLKGLKADNEARSQVNIPAIPLKVKAAITMTEGASLNNSAYLPNVQVLPGIVQPIRVQATFWERLRKGATKANPLVWVNKHNVQGAAAFTAEGNLKPSVSFELESESSVPKKIPAKTKISTEMLTDIDYIAGEVVNELLYQVDKGSNAGVLTGNGIAPNPKGVTGYASAYTLASINGVIAPNNSDAIRAAIAQLRSLNVDGPLTAFINPIDAAVMDLAKSLQGQYVLAPFTTADGRNIAATPVVEDNNIAVGYLLLADMTKYHVLMLQDFTVQWGWENDDFTKNLVTAIAERRFHQYVSDNETVAFLYDTFANIKTAIA